MPGPLSVSLTTGDTRCCVYPENVTYVVQARSDDILYTVVLMPKAETD